MSNVGTMQTRAAMTWAAQVAVRAADALGRSVAIIESAFRGRSIAEIRPLTGVLNSAVMLEIERGGLFLLTPVMLGIGAVFYFVFPLEPGWMATGVALTGSVVLLAAARHRYGFLLAAGVLCLIVLGFAAGKAETSRMSTKVLGQTVTTRLSGQVVRVDRLASGRGRALVDVTRTERPTLRYAPERVRLTGKLPPDLRAGMSISGLARLQPPSGPVMPGGYDFSFRSYFDGIGANGFFLGQPTITGDGDGDGLARWIERSRDAIAGRVRSSIGGAEGEIAAALIVGVRGGIPEHVNEALRITGLAHILSISGVHMALVAATVMGAMRAVLGAFPQFSSRRAVKKAAAATALVAVTIYLLFSGAEVAAVRSYIMLAVMLAAVLLDQAALTMRNLAIAAVAVLLWSPHEILGPSFQMSFAATAALIAAYGFWKDRERSRFGSKSDSIAGHLAFRALRLVAALAATSIVAGAATMVFSIYHFHQTAWMGLPANLLVMPIISMVVMPAGLLAMLAMPFGAEAIFLGAMGAGLHFMLQAADWLSRLSPSDSIGSIPTATMILTSLAIVVIAVTTTWLRVFALPLIVAAMTTASFHIPPDILVSEDARLVGARVGDDLAVNAGREGGFTLENWQRSLGGSIVRSTDKSAAAKPATSSAKTQRQHQFQCADGACALAGPGGFRVAYASTALAAEQYCGNSRLVVINDPTADRGCGTRQRSQLVVGARDVARRGAAAIWVGEGKSPRVEYAIPMPYRPWHEHRKFSRASRGLAERDVKKSDAGSNFKAPGRSDTAGD